MKKLIAALLLLAMLACALVSCAEEAKPTAGKTSAGPRRDVDDGLPELNYGGARVTYLTDTTEGQYLKRDAITNDVLNDAIYNREYKVNSRLGVTMNFIVDDDAGTKASDSVLTGLDEYQILTESAGVILKLASSNTLINLNGDGLTHLNQSQKWYNQYLRDKMTIYDKLYCLTGSLQLTTTTKSAVIGFNQSVLTEHGIDENMYDLVRSGEWTIDKLLDLTKKAYSDTTGDGKTEDDTFGLVYDNSSALDFFWSAFDLSLMSRTDDGGLAFSDDTTKFVTALEKVYAMSYENQNINCYDYETLEGDEAPHALQFLSEDRSMFIMMHLFQCGNELLRNMKSAYGIIPLPKWDASQSDYYTCLRDGYTCFGIPKTNTQLEMTSAVIEALSSESYASVATAYYDKILKGRYMNDPDSQQMLDIITTNINLDYALVHGFSLSNFSTEAWRSILRAGKKNYSSFWRANKKKYINALDEMLAQYLKTDE